MALKYTRRSGGGKYRSRQAPDDRQATAAEQRIIKFLDQQRKEQYNVSKELYKDREGVYKRESDNRNTLNRLRQELQIVQRQNVTKRRDTEVKRLNDLAKQAGAEAEWLAEFSPKAATAAGQLLHGIKDFTQYHLDKWMDDDTSGGPPTGPWLPPDYDWPEPPEVPEDGDWPEQDPDEPGPTDGPDGPWLPPEYDWPEDEKAGLMAMSFAAQDKAFTSITGDTITDQVKLSNFYSWGEESELSESVHGQAAKQNWYGGHYSMKAAKTIDAEWDAVVDFSFNNVKPENQSRELLEAGVNKWMRHKGISKRSKGGRWLKTHVEGKLSAYDKTKVQDHLVAKSQNRILERTETVKALLTNDPNGDLDNALNELTLAYNSRYERTPAGVFISPTKRGNNYGKARDQMMKDALTWKDWKDWREYSRLLKGKILPTKELLHLPYEEQQKILKTWEEQRAHMIPQYKDDFLAYTRRRASIIKQEEEAELAVELTNMAKRLTDPNSTDGDGNPNYLDKNDYTPGGGRDQITALYNQPGQHPEIKKLLGGFNGLSYDPKSSVFMVTHNFIMKAVQDNDFIGFMNYYSNLTPTQQTYYQAELPRLKALHETGHSPKVIKDIIAGKIDPIAKKKQINTATNDSYKKAITGGVQLFSYNLSTLDPKSYNSSKELIDAAWDLTDDMINDPEGLFAIHGVGDANPDPTKRKAIEDSVYFRNFVDNQDETQLTETDLVYKSGEENFTLDQMLDEENLISDDDIVNIQKAIIAGDDSITIPENITHVIRLYPKSKLTERDVINAYFERQGIDIRIPPGPRDFLKRRLSRDENISIIKPENVQTLNAYYNYVEQGNNRPMKPHVASFSKGITDSLEGLKENELVETIIDPDGSIYSVSDIDKTIKEGWKYDIYYDLFNDRWLKL